jgi:hypothetical protein
LALLRAWHEVLLRERNAVWAEGLLDQLPLKKWNPDLFELIAVLPALRRESHWLRLLETGSKSLSTGDLLARIASSLPLDSPMLSADFARQVIQIIKNNFVQNDFARWDYALRTALPELICLFPAEVFAEVAEGWPIEQANSPLVGEKAARVLAVVKQRQTLDSADFLRSGR